VKRRNEVSEVIQERIFLLDTEELSGIEKGEWGEQKGANSIDREHPAAVDLLVRGGERERRTLGVRSNMGN